MSDFIQCYGALNRQNTQCNALSNVNTVVLTFPFDETCVLKDYHWFIDVYRAARFQGVFVLAVLPDDLVAAFQAADFGLAATWQKYEQFIWMKQWIATGSADGDGSSGKFLELKTATSRRVEKDWTITALFFCEDIANVQTQINVGSMHYYKIKSVASP